MVTAQKGRPAAAREFSTKSAQPGCLPPAGLYHLETRDGQSVYSLGLNLEWQSLHAVLAFFKASVAAARSCFLNAAAVAVTWVWKSFANFFHSAISSAFPLLTSCVSS